MLKKDHEQYCVTEEVSNHYRYAMTLLGLSKHFENRDQAEYVDELLQTDA